MSETKAVMKFRVAKGKVEGGLGPFSIESSRGGTWVAGLQGLEAATMDKQMNRLESHGASIEYNEHFPAKEKK